MEDPELKEFVDSLTEEKYNAKIAALDIAKLKELAETYNRNLEVQANEPVEEDEEAAQAIDLDNDKYGLIVELWQRNVDIPEYLNLTWGEPYDTVFKRTSRMAPEDYGWTTTNAIDSFLYQLLKSQIGLAMFLGIAVDFAFDRKKIDRLNFILAELEISPITGNNSDQLQGSYFSKIKLMVPLAKVYLALRLQEDYEKYHQHVHVNAILKVHVSLDEYIKARDL